MKGVNVVVLSGNVGSVQFGVTGNDEEVCTFTLAVEKSRDLVSWARVNVFGGNVVSCRRFLDKGVPVIVQGELMNRYMSQRDFVTEVRCLDIKYLSYDRGRKQEGEVGHGESC